MTSEIRANTLKNRVGLGTISFTNTGAIVSGIVTANSFSGVVKATNLSANRVVFTQTGGQLEASGNLTYNGTTLASGSPVDINADLDVDGHTNLDNVSISGVTTITENLDTSTIDITGTRSIGNDALQLSFSAPEGHIKTKNTGGSPASNLAFHTTDTSGNTNRVMHLRYDGKVGINTTSPTLNGNEEGIHIVSEDYPTLHLTNSTTGHAANNGSMFTLNDTGETIIRNGHASHIRFDTNNGSSIGERLRITSSGAVMINTTNSSSRTLNLKGTFGILSASQTGVLDMSVTDAGAASIGPYVAGGSSLIFKTNASGTGVAERLRIDSTGVARFINSTGELKIASSTNNDSGKIIFQENTTGAWSLEAQRANGYFRILDEYNGNSGSPQERFRITPAGQVSISDDGTTDGLLTIKGNSDATSTPSIRLLDGSDTREVSITNTAGDFIISTHGTDNVAHGSIKIHESGFISLSTNAGAGNLARLKVDLVGSIRHMGTSGYYQITVIHNGSGSGNWYSGSGPQRIYPNYIDNRTGYAEFIIEFHPSTSYSGWEEPTFVICNGNTGGLRTGGTVELNTNRRTNGPNNAVFRAYHGQYSWQIYNDGDSDVTGGQREINRNVEHRSSYWIDGSTQSIDYIHSNDSRYNTNVEPLLNQRSFIKIKMNRTSNTSYAVQGHPFVCRFVCYSQGDQEWYGYMQYN